MARQPRSVPPPRRVALLIETSLASGREILSGVAQYVREHNRWTIQLEPRDLEHVLPKWLAGWKGDGIIARIQRRQIADVVTATGLPVVDVLGMVPEAGIPLVHVDDERVGTLGAEHFLQRQYRHLAFCGFSREVWSQNRQRAFEARAARADASCSLFAVDRRHLYDARRDEVQNQLLEWIRSLPRPVGIMLATDRLGPLVSQACRQAGVRIPEEAAVLGVDNDQPLCDLCTPPLSSVHPDHQRVGYEAARLLDRLMSGSAPPKRPILLPPTQVIQRLSSDATAVQDPLVVTALNFIRENACLGIGADAVVEHSGMSRSLLQTRFRKAVGWTLHDELVRVRLARARELLLQTRLPVQAIAERCGFRYQSHLTAVFRMRLNTTPHRFRVESQEPPKG